MLASCITALSGSQPCLRAQCIIIGHVSSELEAGALAQDSGVHGPECALDAGSPPAVHLEKLFRALHESHLRGVLTLPGPLIAGSPIRLLIGPPLTDSGLTPPRLTWGLDHQLKAPDHQVGLRPINETKIKITPLASLL